MANFEPAFQNTMKFEDPRHTGKVTVDAGGRTRFGIAEKFNANLPEEFFTGDKENALHIAEMRMEENYWRAGGFAQINDQAVANKLFDMAVNMGVHQAVVYGQRAANALLTKSGQLSSAADLESKGDPQPAVPLFPLVVDGELGPKSAELINSLDPLQYYQLLCEFSREHYKHVAAISPAQAVNLNGWLKRADA